MPSASASTPSPLWAEIASPVGMAEGQLAAAVCVDQVDLVERQQAWRIAGADLLEHVLDRPHHLHQFVLRGGRIRDVHDQVGQPRLLQGGAERVHELVGQLADEADRIGDQERAPADADRPGRRIERVEQAVANARRSRRRRACSAAWTCRHWCSRQAQPWAAPPDRARRASRRDSSARQRACAAAWRSDRGRVCGRSRSASRRVRGCRSRRRCARRRGARGASTARACARGCTPAAPARPGACPRRCGRGRRRCRGSPRCGRPPAARAPARGCAPGAAVSSSSQAITFASSSRQERLELGDLAAAEVGVGMGAVAVLDLLAHDGHARRAQQLTQLGEVVALGRHRDAEGPLLRAPGALDAPVARLPAASVATAVHSRRL